jgi:hypothetical protein
LTSFFQHGRVAQLAVLGYIVPEVFRWPGDIAPGLAFADIATVLPLSMSSLPSAGPRSSSLLVLLTTTGFLGDFDSGKPDLDAAEAEKRSLSELQHGRLAMLAILELLRHDSQNLVSPGFDGLDNLITGLPFLYN